jgi:hypothetical protein
MGQRFYKRPPIPTTAQQTFPSPVFLIPYELITIIVICEGTFQIGICKNMQNVI